ncbi:uncharacterized protein LOC144203731 isoform X2 [Stigmatopora nigra]
MTKLEMLNVFLNDRMTAAAQEIFAAVKDTFLEYQSEIQRSQKENERLKRLLNVAVQRLLQPEASLVQSQDHHIFESERGDIVQPQVKKERTLTDVPNIGSSSPLPSQPETQKALDIEEQFTASSSSSTQTVILDGKDCHSDSCGLAENSHTTTQKDLSESKGDQVKVPHCASRKQSVNSLTLKHMKSIKSPSTRISHPTIHRWHSCKECGKSFSFACQLEVHTRWHTKEKPYSCTVCRKSFTTVSMLKRHHRIHTGEKPFRCHVCGKCFNQSAHLNTHFRLHTREPVGWSRVSFPRNRQSTEN